MYCLNGSTLIVLPCVAFPRPDDADEGIDRPVRAVACAGLSMPFEVGIAGNATSSITLHSVSKLRLPLSIRGYLPCYTGLHSWK